MLSLLLLLLELLAWWDWFPAAFCHVGVFFLPWEKIHEERNPNLLSLSPLAPRFLLENFYLDEHVHYIVTIYPVVILWLTGIMSNSASPEHHIYIFAGTVWHLPRTPFLIYFFAIFYSYRYLISSSALILAISCIMFVSHITLVTWKHHKRPLYSDSGPSMSPVEIAMTQRKLCDYYLRASGHLFYSSAVFFWMAISDSWFEIYYIYCIPINITMNVLKHLRMSRIIFNFNQKEFNNNIVFFTVKRNKIRLNKWWINNSK